MKQFWELTKEQQKDAIQFAKQELEKTLSLGILDTKNRLADNEILDLAIEAAEGSQYNDEGKAVTEGMDVPYFYQGGCV